MKLNKVVLVDDSVFSFGFKVVVWCCRAALQYTVFYHFHQRFVTLKSQQLHFAKCSQEAGAAPIPNVNGAVSVLF